MTMIAKIGDWVNPAVAWIKHHRRDLWLGGCSVLIAWSAYNVGLIEGQAGRQPVGAPPVQQATVFRDPSTPTPTKEQGSDPRVFASKNSTGKKYYYSWCSSRVKDTNKTWFPSEAAALAAGYTLAGNCQPR